MRTPGSTAFIMLMGLLPITSVADATTLDVPATYPTIQDAIDAASPADTVLVAPGTYTGAGNRDLDFGGKDIVLRSSDGAEVTIIDCEASAVDSHRGFTLHSGETEAAVVEGLTFRNGFAAGPRPAGDGGAVYLTDASPTILDCVFDNNTAGSFGGALYCELDTWPLIRGCRFTGNHAEAGGAMAGLASGSIFTGAAPVIEDCDFEDNSAHYDGGALYFLSGDGPPVLRNCRIQGNVASWGEGGGAYLQSNPNPDFESCVFEENSASIAGGGVFVHQRSPTSDLGRTALPGYPPLYLTDCVFDGNTAQTGAGAHFEFMDEDVLVTGCLFAGNQASSAGGALLVMRAALRMSSSTLVANGAPSGGNITFGEASNARIDLSILAFSTSGEAVVCDPGLSIILGCSDVYGNTGGDWSGCIAGQDSVAGNFSADPFLCDAPGGDYSLTADSPCLAAPGCGQVGAFGQGCGAATAVPGSATVPSSWGAVKQRLRGSPRQ